jgi:hypothetical protein
MPDPVFVVSPRLLFHGRKSKKHGFNYNKICKLTHFATEPKKSLHAITALRLYDSLSERGQSPSLKISKLVFVKETYRKRHNTHTDVDVVLAGSSTSLSRQLRQRAGSEGRVGFVSSVRAGSEGKAWEGRV